MKIFVLIAVVLVTLVASTAAEDMKARIKEIGQVCSKENGVSDEDVEKFHKGQIKESDVKDNMKCAMNCLMVKVGFMNDAGKFNPEAFKTAFSNSEHKAKALETLEKCKALEGPNPCETSFLITTCMMKEKMEGM